ncbi:MAG TPA: peptidase [Eggerthellaceae bacterium]|nr:peptidase [Eggerthellaceae bacterium]
MGYWMLVIVTLVIGLAASAYVNSQLKKYQKVRSSSGLTGREAAERMLAANGVYGVAIHRGAEGQDHFDPRTNSISLSPSVYDQSTVTAYATACHEVGHACQFAQGYVPLKIRSAIWPVANAASSIWIFILLIGIFLYMNQLITVAIVMYACVVAFQLVTLPVEFNASHRAMDYMKSVNLPQGEVAGSFSVLRACALTYVAAALASLLQLLYLIGMRDN